MLKMNAGTPAALALHLATLTLTITGCKTSTEPNASVDALPSPDSDPPEPDASVGPSRPPGVALCYTAAAEANPATTMFRSALAAGDRSQRADAIEALDAAVQANPDEEELQLFLGLAHLWRLAEPLSGETGPLSQLADATASRDHLKLAYQLCPTDARVPAWLGPVMVMFGRQLGDTAQIDDGLAILDEGIAKYPSFVLFSKLLVFADSPRTSPDFQNALDAVTQDLDACGQAPNDPACNNATVPHNLEGGALFLGDVLTKALERDQAASAYQLAMGVPTFNTWSFHGTVTERLQNLDQRISLYSNASTSDDPPAAWKSTTQCVYCHQQ